MTLSFAQNLEECSSGKIDFQVEFNFHINAIIRSNSTIYIALLSIIPEIRVSCFLCE